MGAGIASTSAPQNRHLTAAHLIVSAQYGHDRVSKATEGVGTFLFPRTTSSTPIISAMPAMIVLCSLAAMRPMLFTPIARHGADSSVHGERADEHHDSNQQHENSQGAHPLLSAAILERDGLYHHHASTRTQHTAGLKRTRSVLDNAVPDASCRTAGSTSVVSRLDRITVPPATQVP